MEKEKVAGSSDIPVLELRDITKTFSTVTVLHQVNLSLMAGEVHALLGENGAGKSTLMKILAGVYQKTSGSIIIDGKEVVFKNRQDSSHQGIGIVFQEFSQVPQMSIIENLFLGRELYKKGRTGFVRQLDWKAMKEKAQHLMEVFNIDCGFDTKIKSLGVARQQLIEIIKALLFDEKILILDEPTATLSDGEIKHLFKVIERLKKEGVTIIYISHRLEEIKQICDRATIMRDGKKITTFDVADKSIDDIITAMIGRELSEIYPPKKRHYGEDLLRFDNVSSEGKFKNVNFSLKEGEILGVTGLIGAGKTEIVNAIFGLDKKFTGNILYKGKEIRMKSPIEAKRNGIAMIPEDRKKNGAILRLSAGENITIANMEAYKNSFRILDQDAMKKTVEKSIQEINVRPADPKKLVRFFSGGNQQKIVISKWIQTGAKLYIFDEPTRGVDVGAKMEIYKLIASLVDSGCGVIVCSSDTQEILGLCHSIIVMNRGLVSACIDCEEADISDINKARLGKEA